MAGTQAAELAESFDFIKRNGRRIENFVILPRPLDSSEMQNRVQEHGSVPGGENEAVAVGPERVLWIVAKKFLPQAVGQRRHRHRRAGMYGIGGAHGAH